MNIKLDFKNFFLELFTPGVVTIPDAIGIFGYQKGDTLNAEDIKKRYRSLAMKYHPDRKCW